ncbi:MAG: DUF1573 domain-containing protein [Rikenellaceae bacterium]
MGLINPIFAIAQLSSADSSSHNFGEIDSRKEVSHTFKAVNSGGQPIVILGSKSSCSCVSVTTPTHPIMAGDSVEVVVKYRAGRKDRGRFSKVIEILSSGEPSRWLLTVTGEVVE